MGARTYWVAPVPPLDSADGSAYASSVTLTDVSPSPPVTLPAYLLEVGTTLRLHARGQFSNTGTPTLLLGFYFGGIAGVALAASSAITTASGVTGVPFELEYRGEVRAIGSSGSINGAGRLYLGTSLTAYTVRPVPEVAASRTVTIDTTSAKAVTLGAQWGTSSSSNTLTCNDLIAELLG
jgi:hypothetical protein